MTQNPLQPPSPSAAGRPQPQYGGPPPIPPAGHAGPAGHSSLGVSAGLPAAGRDRLVPVLGILAAVAIVARLASFAVGVVVPLPTPGSPEPSGLMAVSLLLGGFQTLVCIGLFVVALVVLFRSAGQVRLGAIVVAATLALSAVLSFVQGFVSGFVLSFTQGGVSPGDLMGFAVVSGVILLLIHVGGIAVGALLALRRQR